MDIIFGVIAGLVVGFVVGFFVCKNNPKTIDKVEKVGEIIKGKDE